MVAPLALALAALVPADPDGWDDFPVFVWRHRHAGGELSSELVVPFGGTNVERDDEAAWVRAQGLDFYVGHAPGRDALHLRRGDARWQGFWKPWYSARDVSLAVREPCLSEDATIDALLAQLAASLAAREGDTGLGVSLGDEVGLTPHGDPADVCRSRACEEAWRAWHGARALAVAPECPGTDVVRLALTDGDASLVPGWLARRAFHDDVVLGTLERLAARSRELAPDAPVGLLGIAGDTAFGGIDVERALGFLDFAEPYETAGARALAFTLRRPDQRLLRTVFLHEDDAAGARWQAWEHWMRGGDGLVVWSDALLEDAPAKRAALASAVAEIRALVARFGPLRPAPRGFAIVEDGESQALRWLRDALYEGRTWPRRFAGHHDEHGTYERAHRTWRRLLEDAGYAPGTVPISQVGAELAERYPWLVVSHLEALTEEELSRFDAFLSAGGRILQEGEVGWLDPERGRREELVPLRWSLLDLEATHPAPRGLGDYAESRLTASTSTPRAVARTLAGRADLAPVPFRVERPDEGVVPWLRVAVELEDGALLCAALPALHRVEERRARLAADDRWRVWPTERWELGERFTGDALPVPPGERRYFDARVAAGEALVFTLTPR